MSDVLAINHILSLKFAKVELRSRLKSAKNINTHIIQLISTHSFVHAFSSTYFTLQMLADDTKFVQCWNLP